MGSLWDWEISPEFVKHFPVFIETGYGTGNGLEYAVKHDFKKIYSIEIYPDAVQHGRKKFINDPRVEIIENDSAIGIQALLLDIEEPIFAWLDAHFPGADCFNQPFDQDPEPIRLPLSRELEAFRMFADNMAKEHTILIDDLHCWDDDLPWGMGVAPQFIADALPEKRSLNFLGPFCYTHDVQILLNHKGFALISPRDAPRLRFIGQIGD